MQNKSLSLTELRALSDKLKLWKEKAVHGLLLEKDLEQIIKWPYYEDEKPNILLIDRMYKLNNILELSLQSTFKLSFESLRRHDKFTDFSLPPELSKPCQKEPQFEKEPQLEEFLSRVRSYGFLDMLIPGGKKLYQIELQDAKDKYQKAKDNYQLVKYRWETLESDRLLKIQKYREDYDKEKKEFELGVQEHNQGVDELEKGYQNGNPTAIKSYFTLVLENSVYPKGFPHKFRIAYAPEPKELVIEYELPGMDIVPTVAEFRWIKTKGIIVEKPRKAVDIKVQYQDIVASVCLRTVHEIFEADQNNNILVLVFNGFVNTVDPSTGHDIRPCLISIRTTRERFCEIDLSRIDKRACLRNLGAQVSPRPDEMLAVKPVVEFDMVDKRFVEQSDILSDLENRPNIMELNPWEFENLVTNLFGQIGFQTKQTRTTKDSGVDAIAFDPRPILGGKVVIQAKRYKNVVGVAAVRDLYGTMINEGASKGVLVTTSHYGPDAYDFAKDKPIELIDGGGLLYLLDQQGIKAKIIMPEEEI